MSYVQNKSPRILQDSDIAPPKKYLKLDSPQNVGTNSFAIYSLSPQFSHVSSSVDHSTTQQQKWESKLTHRSTGNSNILKSSMDSPLMFDREPESEEDSIWDKEYFNNTSLSNLNLISSGQKKPTSLYSLSYLDKMNTFQGN